MKSRTSTVEGGRQDITQFNISEIYRVNNWPDTEGTKKLMISLHAYYLSCCKNLGYSKCNPKSFQMKNDTAADRAFGKFVSIYNSVLDTKINNEDEYNNLLNELHEALSDSNLPKKNSNGKMYPDELLTHIGRIKSNPLSRNDKARMEGINGERLKYLNNIVCNLKEINNMMGANKNKTNFSNMIDKIDYLVSLGPEKDIKPTNRHSYDKVKNDAIGAIIEYLEGESISALNINATKRRKASILAAAMIDPAIGEDLSKQYNRSRIREKISRDEMRAMQGPDKGYGAMPMMY